MNIEHFEDVPTNPRSFLRCVAGTAGVLRHHTDWNSTIYKQTVGEHTYELLLILLAISHNPVSASAMITALCHDTSEGVTGDLPSPVKTAIEKQGDINVLQGIDNYVMQRMTSRLLGGMDIDSAPTPEEEDLVRTADLLSGFLYCVRERERGNRCLTEMTRTYFTIFETRKVNARAAELRDALKGWYDELNSK